MLCTMSELGGARPRVLESTGGASPVQERQGKTGPASIHEGEAEETSEVFLQFQVLADEPPDLLWDFVLHFRSARVSWYCTRLEVHKVSL